MNNQLPSKEKFDAYKELGLVEKRKHPELPLYIYTYSIFTNFERLWNLVTLQSRGIVFDKSGRCVVRCMPKFFNEDEPHALCDKPQGETVYYDKMDGSLIQVVNDKEYGLVVTSKGSFASNQSAWATEIINDTLDQTDFIEGRTYVFELIHPDNRIVLDYKGDKELYLITVINIETGKEYNLNKPEYNKFKKVGVIDDIDAHLARNDVEGLVAKTGSHRYKLKTGEYIRLHRIITGFTPKTVWESMKNGDNLEFQDMPEEFTSWLENTIKVIQKQYDDLDAEIRAEYEGSKDLSNKEVGLSNLKWKNHIFSIRNGIDYSESVWKRIKPRDGLYLYDRIN